MMTCRSRMRLTNSSVASCADPVIDRIAGSLPDTRNVELVRYLGADHVVDYTRTDFTHAEKRQDLLTLGDLLATGQVTPVIDSTYPLDDAADALR